MSKTSLEWVHLLLVLLLLLLLLLWLCRPKMMADACLCLHTMANGDADVGMAAMWHFVSAQLRS